MSFLLEQIQVKELLKRFQKDFLVDESGNILVDFIGRMENLQLDFDKICNHLKIPKRALPIRNSSKHMGYKEYYSDNTKQIISETFHEDIALFNYSFET